jgi:hypothetical protein
MSFYKDVWDTLSKVDVSKQIEKKGNLSYLSWAWAWGILMQHYPDSYFEFKEPTILPDGTVEIWVTVTVSDGEKQASRSMWLPVMDHRNNAIQHPDARKISDTRMRCLTKCLAILGLGHYIYAGEDLPTQPESKSPEEVYSELTAKHFDTITAIKDGIAEGRLSAACEAWEELDQDTKIALWKAPRNGGCFTTEERKVMKSKDFREAFFGVQALPTPAP